MDIAAVGTATGGVLQLVGMDLGTKRDTAKKRVERKEKGKVKGKGKEGKEKGGEEGKGKSNSWEVD